MGSACSAVCDDGKVRYEIKYSPSYRTGISKDGLSRLKAQLPDVYDEYVQTTESRCFKLSKTTA